MRKLMWILTSILICIIGFSVIGKNKDVAENPMEETIFEPISTESSQLIASAPKNTPPETIITIEEIPQQEEQKNIPSSTNLELTFFSQAPDANRNLPRQEACEEASIILAAYYINQKALTKDRMRSEILGLVQRQKNVFGDYLHTTTEQTLKMYKEYFGQGKGWIVENPTIDDIKNELAQERIVVAPFAGRLLGNPHYSGMGPRYHMMVIKGYDETYFYTHDVGTVHGENFKYTHETILNANHDYVNGDITQGAKRMIVLER